VVKERRSGDHERIDIHPRSLILAGPNGAGKTTFAGEFLPAEGHCPTFINADLIAAGLSPFVPEYAAVEAARIMLEGIRRRVSQHEDFALETTLAGRSYVAMIHEWRRLGYQVSLFFLQLPSPEVAVSRVRHRVAQGGHNVPEVDIRRRFDRGWRNFQQLYRPIVDEWRVYDAGRWPPILVEEGGNS